MILKKLLIGYRDINDLCNGYLEGLKSKKNWSMEYASCMEKDLKSAEEKFEKLEEMRKNSSRLTQILTESFSSAAHVGLCSASINLTSLRIEVGRNLW